MTDAGTLTPTPVEQRRGRRKGEPARWTVLCTAMAGFESGDTLPYTEMAVLIGMDYADPRQRQIVRATARRAADELRKREKKFVAMVRGEGYKVPEAQEAVVLARRHQARAVTEVATGLAVAESVDLSQVDATTARLIQATVVGFARQEMVMRSFDVRQDRLETAMQALAVSVSTTATRVEQTSVRLDEQDAELAALRKKLLRLETERQDQHIQTS